MLKSLATTVATPSKWPGRAAPSSVSVNVDTRIDVATACGYISCTLGARM